MWQSTKTDSGKVQTLRPIMPGGADYFRDAAVLPPEVASRSENLDTTAGTLARRMGALKLARLAVGGTDGASRTFASVAKYATFTPPLIPAGGFAIQLPGFVATRPTSGNTAFVVGSRPSGQSFHVFKVTLSDAGVLTVAWQDSNGATHTCACTAVNDGTVVHMLCIYDAAAGTLTCWVNGAVSGTPLTGLAQTLKPDQTAGVVWTFGVEKQTSAAVTANSDFDGAFDGMTIFSLRGLRPVSGSTTLQEVLRRHSARVWPNPNQDFVLAHYDMDEASGTVMTDHSQAKNHGVYVGSPSITAPVAYLAAPCNMITRIAIPAGAWNLTTVFGNTFIESIGPAAT